jgi:thiol-disulfide isomerase/thioredoxin
MQLRYINFLVFILLTQLAYGQDKGIQFFHGTWEEVLAKAKEQKKIVFVDAFTTWCGPCKRMASEVFTQESVGNYYNTNFINYKYDMEKDGGPTFARQYKITAYPTLLFIDGDGKEVHRELGFRAPEALVTAGRAALKQTDRSGEFKSRYDKGERSPELLRDYAYALLQSGQENQKIANEYLKTQTDLGTEQNLLFLFDFANEADSRIFELMCQHREALSKHKDAATIAAKVRSACDQTVKKAVSFRNPELLAEAKKKFAAFDKAGAKRFAAEADVVYFRETDQKPELVKALDNLVKKFASKDAPKLYESARELIFTVGSPDALAKAEKWAQKSYALEAKYEHALCYATALMKTGRKKEALAVANEAVKLAVAEGKSPGHAEEVIRQCQE